MSLARYHKKRHFNRTAEPKGSLYKKNDPIFVVQKHAASHLHYDFRLAMNGVLKSWAVPKGPCLDPAVKRLAVEVEDHPLEYATFEGDIPKGEYGGGNVIVWDYGHWESSDDLTKAYHQGSMKFLLQGKKLLGAWKLIRFKRERNQSQWLLIKVKDKYSKKLRVYDITQREPNSVLSKIIRKKSSKKLRSNITPDLAQQIKPELATLSVLLPKGNDWVYETKFDGYRILAYVDKNKVRLFSRNHLDWTEKFSAIAEELKKMNFRHTVVDGEIVALDKNHKSNFQTLQNFLNEDVGKANLHYFVFDLLFYNKQDLTELSLVERKDHLSHIIKRSSKLVHYTEHLEGDSKKLLKMACREGQEGIMAKKKDSVYVQARTKDWLKLKCHKRDEFIVVGFTAPQGARDYFGALLLATRIRGKLVYCGNVGTGFNRQSLKEIYQKLIKLKQNKTPLEKKPTVSVGKNISWTKPRLVVDVEFTEWTQEGCLRHPSFKGIRADKM